MQPFEKRKLLLPIINSLLNKLTSEGEASFEAAEAALEGPYNAARNKKEAVVVIEDWFDNWLNATDASNAYQAFVKQYALCRILTSYLKAWQVMLKDDVFVAVLSMEAYTINSSASDAEKFKSIVGLSEAATQTINQDSLKKYESNKFWNNVGMYGTEVTISLGLIGMVAALALGVVSMPLGVLVLSLLLVAAVAVSLVGSSVSSVRFFKEEPSVPKAFDALCDWQDKKDFKTNVLRSYMIMNQQVLMGGDCDSCCPVIKSHQVDDSFGNTSIAMIAEHAFSPEVIAQSLAVSTGLTV